MIPPGMNTQFAFAVISFNSSESKLCGMDGLRHNCPPPFLPIFH